MRCEPAVSEASAVKVLARLKPGCAYTMWELSNLIGWKSETVRPIVEQMGRDGLLVSRIRDDRHKCFYIAGTEDLKIKSAPKAANVATPLIPVLMTGELSGYECQFTRHRDLCMSIRRAA
jgi:hypothetical protein